MYVLFGSLTKVCKQRLNLDVFYWVRLDMHEGFLLEFWTVLVVVLVSPA